jgi:hypothetical protein
VATPSPNDFEQGNSTGVFSLPKISRQYIGSALFVRYMDNRPRRYMRKIRFLLVGLFVATSSSSFAAMEEASALSTTSPKDENSRDIFSIESVYTLSSDFRNESRRLGDGDSFYSDFTYDHRFLITGKWYFRAGVEYERYDFGGTNNGMPDHLQAAYGHLALEYVVHDFPGVLLEINPGVFFQNRITSGAFDVPAKAYVVFPIQDKIFGLIGLAGGLNQNPAIAPGGGIIWLFSDKLRLQGVFPKPALVYEPNNDWQFQLVGELIYQSFRTDDVITPLAKLRVHNAVVQYNEDRAGVQVHYSGFKPFGITAGAGYTIIRDFNFFRHGVRERLEPAPFFRLSVDARF